MASSSSSDNDGTENTEHEEKTKRTKIARTSKWDVPEYKWTEDAVQLIADFVKENSATCKHLCSKLASSEFHILMTIDMLN